mmetsp:Transcript_126195/g.351608  ORF Transcript_126195/g.351608 Transcript_126195/m.351608 type:complete len:225 (+) Transcript_126195:413-1087(+)
MGIDGMTWRAAGEDFIVAERWRQGRCVGITLGGVGQHLVHTVDECQGAGQGFAQRVCRRLVTAASQQRRCCLRCLGLHGHRCGAHTSISLQRSTVATGSTQAAGELVDLLELLPANLLCELHAPAGLLLLHLTLRRDLCLQFRVVVCEAQPKLGEIWSRDQVHSLCEHCVSGMCLQALRAREKAYPGFPFMWRIEEVLADLGERQHHMPQDHSALRHPPPYTEL